MPTDQPTHRPPNIFIPASMDPFARATYDRCVHALRTELKPLHVADRNRVLLALAAAIAMQLEVLENDTTTEPA